MNQHGHESYTEAEFWIFLLKGTLSVKQQNGSVYWVYSLYRLYTTQRISFWLGLIGLIPSGRTCLGELVSFFWGRTCFRNYWLQIPEVNQVSVELILYAVNRKIPCSLSKTRFNGVHKVAERFLADIAVGTAASSLHGVLILSSVQTVSYHWLNRIQSATFHCVMAHAPYRLQFQLDIHSTWFVDMV